MSRALGDFICKNNRSLPPEQQVVTANPDVTVHDITEEDEFLIIACDGVFHSFMVLSFSLTPLLQVSGTACPHNKLLISFDSQSQKARSLPRSRR